MAAPQVKPPTQQTRCLRRHGLLLPGEAERLGAANFEPEAIEPEVDPDEAA